MIRSILLLVILLFPHACSLADDAPRWKFAKGDELRYEVLQHTTIEMTAGDAGGFSTDARQTLGVVWRVDSVDADGTMTGVQKVEHIVVAIKQPSGLELVYESDSAEAPAGLSAMLAPLFETLLETEVPITVSARGEITNATLPEKMKQRLAGIPATRPMAELVSEAGIRRLAEQIALLLPAKENEPAGREQLVENRVLGTLRGTLNWKPTGTEGELVKLEPALELSVTPTKKADEDPYLPVRPFANPKIAQQSVEGTAKFDTATGRLKKSTLLLDLVLSGELMGASVESQMKQRVEVTAE